MTLSHPSKNLFIFALLAVMAGSLLTSQFHKPWLVSARIGIATAPQGVLPAQTNAQGEYSSSWQRLKSSSQAKIRDNVARLSTLKAQRAKAGRSFRTIYDRRMAELERRNNALSERLKAYVGDRGDALAETKSMK
jgi:hypothetical protein